MKAATLFCRAWTFPEYSKFMRMSSFLRGLNPPFPFLPWFRRGMEIGDELGRWFCAGWELGELSRVACALAATSHGKSFTRGRSLRARRAGESAGGGETPRPPRHSINGC